LGMPLEEHIERARWWIRAAFLLTLLMILPATAVVAAIVGTAPPAVIILAIIMTVPVAVYVLL